MVTPYRSRYLRPADPRLGRHINHDPRSRRFPVRAAGPIESVQHVRHVPVFDQGQLGSCTGNAAVGCLGTGMFFATMDQREQAIVPLNEQGAVEVYSRATVLDNFDGTYPPDDTGSDGLSVAKVLKADGFISGYSHAFGIDDLLAGLMHTPCIVGTEWTDGMFNPDAEGIIHPTGAAAGGHEYVCDGYDADRELLWFTNSWGTSWAWSGRHAMPVAEFASLLSRDGDATFFVPSDQPAPDPAPVPDLDADAELAAKVSKWARKANPRTAIKPRRALGEWLDAKGL
jgi:hypothetical protein